MGTSGLYALVTATVLLAACTSVLMLLRIAFARRTIAYTVELPAQQAIADFMKQVNLLRKERAVLEEHLNEYFQTFHEAGWPNLLKLLVRLGQAETQLKQMMIDGRYEDALELANLLLGRIQQDALPSAKLKFASGALLVGWKAEADKIIMNVAQSLQEAATETEEVGVSRTRKRQSTLLALHEVRDMYRRGRDK